MKKTQLFGGLLLAMTLAVPAGAADKVIKMSTTTSTQDSGLLDVLLPALEKDTGIQVKVIAKGTGAAIRDGVDGNVDAIFVHDTAREEKFVADGFGTKRYGVMHNDFIVIGPAADPAKVKGTPEGAEALQKIAAAKQPFVSRGDDSGTHAKEQDLWKKSGVALEDATNSMDKDGKKVEIKSVQPADAKAWYLSVGQGMGKTLTITDEKQGYTLADRGTYIKYNAAAKGDAPLKILVEGDKALLNQYSVMMVNPAKCPKVKQEAAKKFINWWISPNTQKAIASFQLEGKQLFFPNAKAGK